MKKIIFALLSVVLLSSCATRDEVVYFQDIDGQSFQNVDSLYTHPEIRVNDILRIDVNALNQESLKPYKFFSIDAQTSTNRGRRPSLFQGYLVNINGEINYPGLGKVKVAGLSTQEAQSLIQKKLAKYIKEPTVRLRLMNFKVTFLGAVNGPTTLELEEESVTIPQAIGLAGDLHLKGLRKNMLLIRQKPNGERETHRIDMTESDWMNNPYFYLQPNDIVYVEPNNPRVSSAGYIDDISTLFSATSIILSLVSILLR